MSRNYYLAIKYESNFLLIAINALRFSDFFERYADKRFIFPRGMGSWEEDVLALAGQWVDPIEQASKKHSSYPSSVVRREALRSSPPQGRW